MREIAYSNSAKALIRFFCINGILVEVLCIIRLFLRTNFDLDIPEIMNLKTFLSSDLNIAIVDFASLFFFIILLFVPQHISIFALISFMYSFKIILVDTLAELPIGQLLYLTGISCLLYLGYFKNRRILKIIISITLNFILIGFSARFGAIVCINSFIASIGYSLVFLVGIFFTTNFLKLIHVKRTARIWDLTQYPELTSRDRQWLKQILDEKKYEEIASESGVTVGTLKNRMHQIFNVVGIEDRTSLLATYSGYEVKI